jgi:alpha-tubulin suppressor-like RCC1 family protein
VENPGYKFVNRLKSLLLNEGDSRDPYFKIKSYPKVLEIVREIILSSSLGNTKYDDIEDIVKFVDYRYFPDTTQSSISNYKRQHYNFDPITVFRKWSDFKKKKQFYDLITVRYTALEEDLNASDFVINTVKALVTLFLLIENVYYLEDDILQIKGQPTVIVPAPAPATAGDPYGCGSNVSGCVGDNTVIQRDDPVQVVGVGAVSFLDKIELVRGGGYNGLNSHTLGVDEDKKAYGWGEGSTGQLGDGTATDKPAPIRILGVGGAGFIAAANAGAGGTHSLFLHDDGTVYACGGDTNSQCGDGAGGGQNNVLIQVVDNPGTGFLTNIADIDAGYIHSIACDDSGNVWCWGSNDKGQLGRGAPLGNFATPQQVLGPGGVGVLSNIIKVAAGYKFSVALASDGSVWCWGENSFGQLGNDNIGINENFPVKVVGVGGGGFLGNVTKIDAPAGGHHVLALLSDNKVVSWGYGTSGQMSNGDFNNNPFPDHMLDTPGTNPIENIVDVAAGARHSIVCDSNGDSWTCGSGTTGQLGQGAPAPFAEWLLLQVKGVGAVGFLTGALKVGAGYGTSFAIIP